MSRCEADVVATLEWGERDIQMSDANNGFQFWLCQDPPGVLLQVKNIGKRSSTTELA